MRPTPLQLVQLEDLLTEMGARGAVGRAFMVAFRGEDDWLLVWAQKHPGMAGQGYRKLPPNVRITCEQRQQFFDGLAAFMPQALEDLLYKDWCDALHENRERARFGRGWRRERPPMDRDEALVRVRY